jgi:flagellar M-ring protein FliF
MNNKGKALDNGTWWGKLGSAARVSLVLGGILIVGATAAMGYWVLRTDYHVLFSELAPADAAAMAGELDRLKVPYKLGEDGSSILVDKDQVYKTRMKLMGKELPLRGAVGFELFNNSDFGMTEFAQKINYQRALQGEITRTILSLTQIKDARVILVMPEQGLFKQASSKAKASITLTMKQGQALRGEQVTGIQRLVSASVPGISTQDVTILDQNGVALSRNAAIEGEAEAGTGRLDLKKETENYLSRKAGEVLERAFGPGEAMASVDVVLNTERAQVTTEDLVVPPVKAGQASTGVVVRERETLRDSGGPLEVKTYDGMVSQRSGSSQREVEYAVGRRVEQIVSQPGGIRRLQAVAVVRRTLDADQQEQIRRLLAAAVGASVDRGDTVVVHTLEKVGFVPAVRHAPDAPSLPAPVLSAQVLPAQQLVPGRKPAIPAPSIATALEALGEQWTALVFPVVLISLAALLLLLERKRAAAEIHGAQSPLTESQRQVALAKVQGWLAAESTSANTGEGR